MYISLYISGLQDQEHWENGAYLRYQSLLGFLVMVVVCVKGIEKEVLKKLNLLDDLNTFHRGSKRGENLGEDHTLEVCNS